MYAAHAQLRMRRDEIFANDPSRSTPAGCWSNSGAVVAGHDMLWLSQVKSQAVVDR